MQEKASPSPGDGADTEGGNGRRARGHCILTRNQRAAWEHTGAVLAEGGAGSAGEHGAELY